VQFADRDNRPNEPPNGTVAALITIEIDFGTFLPRWRLQKRPMAITCLARVTFSRFCRSWANSLTLTCSQRRGTHSAQIVTRPGARQWNYFAGTGPESDLPL